MFIEINYRGKAIHVYIVQGRRRVAFQDVAYRNLAAAKMAVDEIVDAQELSNSL